jgi:hypothetical protein
VIHLSLETWPDAVKEKNNFEALPLHAACSANAPLDVIRWLVGMWPGAVKEKNNYGMTPLAYAKKFSADAHTISWLENMSSLVVF